MTLMTEPRPVLASRARITVTVLADDPVTHAGLTGQIRGRPELELVGARNGQIGQVVIVAAQLIDSRRLEQIAALRSHARARVMVVVSEIDCPTLLATVDAGACVVVRRREATNERLADAVNAAAAGESSLPADLLGRLMDSSVGGGLVAGLAPKNAVTHREVRVLRLLADGYSTAEIASELAYSESTIKSAIHEMTSRLELRNRSHAVAFAVRSGLI